VGDLVDRVLGRQDLALLGHLQPPLDGAARQGEDGHVGRAAAAPDRAAAAVEEDPAEAAGAEHARHLHLGPVGGPRGGDVAHVLVRVRVADHDLLLVADRAQRVAVLLPVERGAHRRRGGGEGLTGLEPAARCAAPPPCRRRGPGPTPS